MVGIVSLTKGRFFYWATSSGLKGHPEAGLEEGWVGPETCRKAVAEVLESCQQGSRGPGNTRLPEQGLWLLLAAQNILDTEINNW